MREKISLFMIPFAGGDRFSFKKFEYHLKDYFDIYCLELPGRGERLSEELIRDIYLARDDLFNQIKNKIDNRYIIFGHSLGGILGYLLILLIEENRLPKPIKFIVSGESNPKCKPTSIRHNLSKDSFIESLKNLGGMPKSFFDYPELFDFFEPILRADFEIYEKFSFDENRKIDTGLSVLYGKEDFFSLEEAVKWKEFSYKNTDFYQFDGGHFFIFDNIEEICNIVKQQ